MMRMGPIVVPCWREPPADFREVVRGIALAHALMADRVAVVDGGIVFSLSSWCENTISFNHGVEAVIEAVALRYVEDPPDDDPPFGSAFENRLTPPVLALSPTTAPALAGIRPVGDPIERALCGVGSDIAAMYRQAMQDLAVPNRESFVGVAATLREVLTAVLHTLAPDDRVRAEPWWRPEGTTGRPTRRQRVRYILRLRARAHDVAAHAVDEIERRVARLANNVYDQANAATHTTRFRRREMSALVAYVTGLLHDLLAPDSGGARDRAGPVSSPFVTSSPS
jgi:predicted pPIWI-associating nuclease